MLNKATCGFIVVGPDKDEDLGWTFVPGSDGEYSLEPQTTVENRFVLIKNKELEQSLTWYGYVKQGYRLCRAERIIEIDHSRGTWA